MKKILPAFFGFIFLLSFLFSAQTHAQTITPAAATTITTSSTTPNAVAPPTSGCPDGKWCQDAETTFVGKTASRAGSFLDWSLQNYNWSSTPTNLQNTD